MATDIVIDPRTLDFVDTADGEWLESDDGSTAVMCQLEARENAWWGDPPSGTQNKAILESELATVDALTNSTTRGLRALQAGGVISDAALRVLEEDNARGYASLYITWTDRRSTRPADLAYSPMDVNPYDRFGPNQ